MAKDEKVGSEVYDG